jgi:hypothetical protein
VAPGLESLDDADLIRGKILLAFERAEEIAALDHADTEGIRQLLTFVLVGAGRKKLHDDLLAQHPEWIDPDGNCPTCDDYDRRFAELISIFQGASQRSPAA